MSESSICQACMESSCPVVKSVKGLLGAWARERRRQGVGGARMFEELPDQAAMDSAVDKPVDNLIVSPAKCGCECHKEVR